MNNKQSKLTTREEIVDAIRQLDENDLRYLNRMIVERIKLICQARSTAMLSNFTVGDRVSFSAPSGEHVSGTIIRINKKTASITTGDGVQWNVHPRFLTREGQNVEITPPLFRQLESMEADDE